MRFAGHVVDIGNQPHFAVRRGDDALGRTRDQALRLAAVVDEVGDGADFQLMLRGKFDEIGQARHATVVLEDFANHGGRLQAGQAGEVATGFGMAGAYQHTAVFRRQREDMTRTDDVGGAGVAGDGGLYGACAIRGGNAGGHPLRGFDRHREVGVHAGAVLLHHGGQVELAAACVGQGQANKAAAMLGHEIDVGGSGELCAQHQIAFVFAVFLVNQDHHAALADFIDDFGDGADGSAHGLAFRIRHFHRRHSTAPCVPHSAQ